MFKNFDPARDIVNQLSVVNELITFGGSIFTGSAAEPTIKKFNHWASGSNSGSFYHALYSTTHTDASAVELIDVTVGYSLSSSFYLKTSGSNKVEKLKIYREFAKMLLGNENNFFNIDGDNRHEIIFLSVRRSQFKDEIKKGTVGLTSIFSGASYTGSAAIVNTERVFNDVAAASTYERTIRGDVGNIKSGSLTAGKIYYQAGVVALIPDRFSSTSSVPAGNTWSGSADFETLMVTSGTNVTYDNLIGAVRNRVRGFSFINQSNLHSTFFFCRALNDEFNYSSNPTFIDTAGRIIPTSGATNLLTRTYITKAALMGENKEILAIASLSQPLKKTPDTEYTIKVRLDF